MPENLRPWARLLAGTMAAVACAMATAVVVDSLTLTDGERRCLLLKDPRDSATCLATVDAARESGSVPGAVLLALASGVAAALSLHDAHSSLR